MVDVKPLPQVTAKWEQRASGAGAEYAQNAAAAGTRYATEAAQAGQTYAQGVQAAIGRGAYQKGVQEAGAAKYTQGVREKGQARYAGGITAGRGNYSQGMQGVLSTLQGVTLPPRGPRGSPGNIQRVAAIAQALNQARTGGGGA